MSMDPDTGLTCDISPLLRFHFWKPIYFNFDDSNFPSDSKEEAVRFVCISKIVGNDINLFILRITTNKVISRSNVRPSGEPSSPNLRIGPLTGPQIFKSFYIPSNHLEDTEEPHAATEQASPNYSNS